MSMTKPAYPALFHSIHRQLADVEYPITKEGLAEKAVIPTAIAKISSRENFCSLSSIKSLHSSPFITFHLE